MKSCLTSLAALKALLPGNYDILCGRSFGRTRCALFWGFLIEPPKGTYGERPGRQARDSRLSSMEFQASSMSVGGLWRL